MSLIPPQELDNEDLLAEYRTAVLRAYELELELQKRLE